MPIERLTEPDQQFINRLGDGLSGHAQHFLGKPGFHGVGVRATDENGVLIGGIQAWINWNWMQVCLVWIDERHRGGGLGSAMLAEIEQIGVERGCRYAHLDTFSFQAPEFYKRHGYEIFATLDHYPGGHQRHYMKKRLGN